MNKRVWLSSLLFLAAFWFISCSSSNHVDEPIDPLVQLAKDTVAIDNYLADNNLTAEKDVSGVRIIVTKLGSGLPASYYINSTVEVDYEGKLFSDGTIFDHGTITGPIKDFITGWQIALASLPAGSEATVYIPSGYAYGATTQGPIPANSILVFKMNFKRIIISAPQAAQFTSDTTAIENHLGASDTLFIKDSSGLRYRITQTGTGDVPLFYDRIGITYSYRLLSDTTKIIGTYTKAPTKDSHSRIVDYLQGMQVALLKMPKGSKAKLYIPSSLAFAGNSIRNNNNEIIIQANSNLVIDLELTDIFK
jgi:FKBP-type peptidyl-prolyl cis-trans isomerase